MLMLEVLRRIDREMESDIKEFPGWPENYFEGISIIGTKYGEICKSINNGETQQALTNAAQCVTVCMRFMEGIEKHKNQMLGLEEIDLPEHEKDQRTRYWCGDADTTMYAIDWQGPGWYAQFKKARFDNTKKRNYYLIIKMADVNQANNSINSKILYNQVLINHIGDWDEMEWRNE